MAKEFKGTTADGASINFALDEHDTMEGFEQISNETMAVPFIRILQKLSPQLDKNKPEYIEGAEEGQYFNTLTKKVYGSTFNAIVLKFERIYIEWKPNRGGFVGYHTIDDAHRLAVDQTFGAWKTKEGNLLQENYVYILLVEGFENDGVVVLSLSSSAIKTAREWNRLMTTHVMDNGQKALPYYLVWKMGSEYKKNEKGTWYNPTVAFNGYIQEKAYNVAKIERKALPSKQIDYAQIEAKESTPDTEY